MTKLKNDLFDHKETYKIQAGLYKEIGSLKEQIFEMPLENDQLKARVTRLEAGVASSKKETDVDKLLTIRASLIAHFRMLEHDYLDAMGHDFDSAVEQIQLVNLGVHLVTDGIRPYHQIIDGQVVAPEGYDEDWGSQYDEEECA